jgi:hypothetical protein
VRTWIVCEDVDNHVSEEENDTQKMNDEKSLGDDCDKLIWKMTNKVRTM